MGGTYVFVIDKQSEWRVFKCQVSTYHKLNTSGFLRQLHTPAQQYVVPFQIKT